MPDPQARLVPRTSDAAGEPFDWFLRIPNRLHLLKPVRELVAATCRAHGLGEDDIQELLLAVSELVNNAIEHVQGRRPDGYHEVDVSFGVFEGRAVGRIVDEGEQNISQADFDDAGRPGLDDSRGRGLFLVRSYVDSIRVRRLEGVGTEIRFEKRLRGGAAGGGA